jgi:hypothetical protein
MCILFVSGIYTVWTSGGKVIVLGKVSVVFFGFNTWWRYRTWSKPQTFPSQLIKANILLYNWSYIAAKDDITKSNISWYIHVSIHPSNQFHPSILSIPHISSIPPFDIFTFHLKRTFDVLNTSRNERENNFDSCISAVWVSTWQRVYYSRSNIFVWRPW